jgi:hypothetical protein
MISNEIDTLKPSKIHIRTTPIKHLSRFHIYMGNNIECI